MIITKINGIITCARANCIRDTIITAHSVITRGTNIMFKAINAIAIINRLCASC